MDLRVVALEKIARKPIHGEGAPRKQVVRQSDNSDVTCGRSPSHLNTLLKNRFKKPLNFDGKIDLIVGRY